MPTIRSIVFLGLALYCVLPIHAVHTGMQTSKPHPMMRGVPGVPFNNTIIGTQLEGTIRVTVDGWEATIVSPPTATELVIRLPDELGLPDPARATTYEICRYEASRSECRSAGVSGDQPTAVPPTRVGTIELPSHMTDFTLCEDALYALGEDALYIFDVSDAATPSILTVLEVEDPLGLTHQGTLVSVSTAGGQLLLIDAAVPADPVVRQVVDLGGTVFDLASNDRYVFGLGGALGLVIVDVTARPESAVIARVPPDALIGEYDYAHVGPNVYADGAWVYVSTYHDFGPDRSTAVDVSTPSTPVVYPVSAIPMSESMIFKGEEIYTDYFVDYQIGEDTDFGFIGTEPTAPLMFVGTRGGLGFPYQPYETARTEHAGGPISIGGNHLYSYGGEIIDLVDPRAPVYGTWINELGTPVPNRDHVYYYQWPPALILYDVSGLPNFDGTPDECGPTPLFVELVEFTASAVPRGVQLRWKTAIELDNVGFRVLRSLSKSEPEAISPWIPASGSELHGSSYEYVDAFRGSPGKVWYYLEDIDLFGRVTRHGPITLPHGRQLRVADHGPAGDERRPRP